MLPPHPHLFLFSIILSLTAHAQADLIPTASSPTIQSPFTNPPPTTCPVQQDGYTSDAFPWTANPPCINVVLPSSDELQPEYSTFCVFSNVYYNNDRGISFIVTPDVAASLTSETFGMGIGGLEGAVGKEMGMWEVKEAGEKGMGLFAKGNVAGIWAGESVVVQTPVLVVDREMLDMDGPEVEGLLEKAVETLPEATIEEMKKLLKGRKDGVAKWVGMNGISVKWPWVDEVPELTIIIPEVAHINHACRPNTLWRFNDYTLSFEVFTLKDIKPGEEITRSYGFEKRPHHRRVRSLEDNFGFTCQCELCSASASAIEASNDRLSDIKALKSILPTEEKDTSQLLDLLPKLIKLLEEEDLVDELPMYEEILAYTWSSFGKADDAKYWAGRARAHWAVVAGKVSWEERRCRELEEDVTGHDTWKSWEREAREGDREHERE